VSAVRRLKQRSKLPAGDRIVQIPCEHCSTTILVWNNDPILYPYYRYKKLCSYCRAAERAENAAIFSSNR
jgi:hypothetical protein